jgi:hypothetical protein
MSFSWAASGTPFEALAAAGSSLPASKSLPGTVPFFGIMAGQCLGRRATPAGHGQNGWCEHDGAPPLPGGNGLYWGVMAPLRRSKRPDNPLTLLDLPACPGRQLRTREWVRHGDGHLYLILVAPLRSYPSGTLQQSTGAGWPSARSRSWLMPAEAGSCPLRRFTARVMAPVCSYRHLRPVTLPPCLGRHLRDGCGSGCGWSGLSQANSAFSLVLIARAVGNLTWERDTASRSSWAGGQLINRYRRQRDLGKHEEEGCARGSKS